MKSLSEISIGKLVAASWLMVALLACQANHSSPAPTREQTSPTVPSDQKSFVSAANGIAIQIQKKTDLRSDRANLDEFKKNLNSYNTSIQIPEDVFVGDIRIIRSLNSTALSPHYDEISKNQAIYEDGAYLLLDSLSPWDKDLTPKTITYKVISQEKTLAEASFELLPDFLVTTNENRNVTLSSLKILSGQYRFGVIFFEKGSVLNTEGAAVQFQAERLYADDATIESFTKEQAQTLPPDGEAGRSGGSISIRAVSAAGRIKFEMRGTTGGRGYAAPLQMQVRGAGLQGTPGVVRPHCDAPFSKSWDPSVARMQSQIFRFCGPICVRNPGDGLRGENGFDGIQGGRGAIGGPSGFVELDIEKQEPEFQVQVVHVPGNGGPGGVGSPGTPGGEGGLPGQDFNVCAKARKGAPGAHGLAGEIGETGAVGITESSQVTIAKQRIL